MPAIDVVAVRIIKAGSVAAESLFSRAVSSDCEEEDADGSDSSSRASRRFAAGDDDPAGGRRSAAGRAARRLEICEGLFFTPEPRGARSRCAARTAGRSIDRMHVAR